MLRNGLVALALAALLVAPGAGESPLVVLDASGIVQGQLIDLNVDMNYPTFAYELDTGGFALFRVNGVGYAPSYSGSFYTSPDCNGPIYLAQDVRSQGSILDPAYWITLVNPASTEVIVKDVKATPVQDLEVVSQYSPGGCTNVTPNIRGLVQVTLVESMRDYTPPFRVAPNPTIFWDQFQTGDMSRWSNY